MGMMERKKLRRTLWASILSLLGHMPGNKCPSLQLLFGHEKQNS
jgi:hypothetical protein